MSMSNFQIILDNPYETYFGGQEMTGRITFDLAKEKRTRGVELGFQGQAHVWWTESRSTTGSDGKSTTVTDSYSNTEKYFDQTVYVMGGRDQDMTLPPGRYSYPFRFMLPYNIPSSFEGPHGHVRYLVKARIDRPWRFDHRCKRAFTVLCPVDLNGELDIKSPYQASKEKTLCCCCCRSGPITLVANLPFRGFVPGQQVNAVVEIDNPTDSNITLKCYLIQKVIFRASCGRTKESEKVLEKEALGSLMGRGSLTRRSFLKIPAVPSSSLRFCNCIEITYKFQVQGCLSGMHTDPIIDVPITIGTIPLREQFGMLCAPEPQLPSAPVMPSAPALPSVPGMPPPGPSDQPFKPFPPPPYPVISDYPDMPPPSYEECMNGKANIRTREDDEYVQGNMEFAPRYPIYHFK